VCCVLNLYNCVEGGGAFSFFPINWLRSFFPSQCFKKKLAHTFHTQHVGRGGVSIFCDSREMTTTLQSLRHALFRIFYRVFLEYFVEKNLVPDLILRAGIRYNLRTKCLGSFRTNEEELQYEMDFIRGLKTKAVAVETDLANEQHYEVPTELYLHCLGSRLKYSCCLYDDDDKEKKFSKLWWWSSSSTSRRSLNEAEVKMMELYCERGEFKDGQEVLELGCGWGSLSIFLAEKYPNSRITAVSNSKTQKEFIDSRARERNITNLQIITQDLNVFKPPLGKNSYDRIVSIECFEHMKNYEVLFGRCEQWLKSSGEAKMFLHIFAHKTYPFHFIAEDESDWMSKYFFSGGTMPSERMFAYFTTNKLHLKTQWRVNGKHYSKTCEDWLRKFDTNRKAVKPIIGEAYGKELTTKWYVYWRLFFLSCSELFNYSDGNEWFVSHYLFEKSS